MGFRSQLTAAQINQLFNQAGDLDGGEALSTFEDVDGGTATTTVFDVTYDGGNASG